MVTRSKLRSKKQTRRLRRSRKQRGGVGLLGLDTSHFIRFIDDALEDNWNAPLERGGTVNNGARRIMYIASLFKTTSNRLYNPNNFYTLERGGEEPTGPGGFVTAEGIVKIRDENGNVTVNGYVFPEQLDYDSCKSWFTKGELDTIESTKCRGKFLKQYYKGNLLRNYDGGEKFKEEVKKDNIFKGYLKGD